MQNPIGFQGVSDKCLSVIRESTVLSTVVVVAAAAATGFFSMLNVS